MLDLKASDLRARSIFEPSSESRRTGVMSDALVTKIRQQAPKVDQTVGVAVTDPRDRQGSSRLCVNGAVESIHRWKVALLDTW